MKKFSSILVFFLISTQFFAQNVDVQSLFEKINGNQKKRLKNIFSITNRDSVFAEFDNSMEQLFTNKTICNKLPDTSLNYFLVNKLSNIKSGVTLAYAFMNNIVICTDVNSKIKMYSWDELDGGSCHSYKNYLLYKDDNEICIINCIDTFKNNIEVGYYSIEQINIPKRELFMFFGYGTYGSGKHHHVVRLFEFKKGKLFECFDCYPNNEIIMIGANRSQNIDLKFNSKKNIISYKEYEIDNETGFYSEKLKNAELKFEKGKFKKN